VARQRDRLGLPGSAGQCEQPQPLTQTLRGQKLAFEATSWAEQQRDLGKRSNPFWRDDDLRVVSLTIHSIDAMWRYEIIQSFLSLSDIYCPNERQLGGDDTMKKLAVVLTVLAAIAGGAATFNALTATPASAANAGCDSQDYRKGRCYT
jgi:hypothetical protein